MCLKIRVDSDRKETGKNLAQNETLLNTETSARAFSNNLFGVGRDISNLY